MCRTRWRHRGHTRRRGRQQRGQWRRRRSVELRGVGTTSWSFTHEALRLHALASFPLLQHAPRCARRCSSRSQQLQKRKQQKSRRVSRHGGRSPHGNTVGVLEDVQLLAAAAQEPLDATDVAPRHARVQHQLVTQQPARRFSCGGRLVTRGAERVPQQSKHLKL